MSFSERYDVQSELGRGGMGRVLLAQDRALRREVAIKVLSPTYTSTTALDRLRREAQMQARLEHANIVRIYDVGDSGADRGLFFVMEYVRGASFGELLSNLKLVERLHVIAEVCRGLAFAHSRDLVHRDLKPENVLISVSGDVKLADFGLSRAVEEEIRLTREGATVGSVHYMAPEQGSGKPVDCRTDLYSVGVILYRAATNKLPFVGRSLDLIYQHVHATPKLPRHSDASLPEELESLILRLLEKDPARRPASADEVAAELDRIIAAYWPIVSKSELRKILGAKASVIALQPKPKPNHGPDSLLPAVRANPAARNAKVAGERSPASFAVMSPAAGQATLKIGCTRCGRELQLSTESIGTLLECPACGNRFRLHRVKRQSSPSRAACRDSSPRETAYSLAPTQRTPVSSRLEGLIDDEPASVLPLAPAPVRNDSSRRRQQKRNNATSPLALVGACASLVIAAGLILYQVRASRINLPTADNGSPPNGIESGPVFVVVPVPDRATGHTDSPSPQVQVAPQNEPQIIALAKPAVCLIETSIGSGSGFLVGDRKTIVTAAHVIDQIESLDEIRFVFSPGQLNAETINGRGAMLLHFDIGHDLAIFRLPDAVSANRTPITVSGEDPMQGESLIAIGNPSLGDSGTISPTSTSFGRVRNVLVDRIEIDIPLNPGDSGGPILSAKNGSVVAVVSHRIEDRAGIAFGMSWRLVTQALDRIRSAPPDQLSTIAVANWHELETKRRFLRLFVAVKLLDLAGEIYKEICVEVSTLADKYGSEDEANKHLPRIRKEVQSEHSPRLDPIVRFFEKQHVWIQATTDIDAATRRQFDSVYSQYRELKREAEDLPKAKSYRAFRERVFCKYDRFHKLDDELAEKIAEEIK